MDYSEKDELASNKEFPYYRKTPVSRSIKQNGEFLFSKQRRREPVTHYIPPHRRKDSIEDGSLSSKRSESHQVSTRRWPAPAVDPRDALLNEGDTYPQESLFSKRSKSYNQVSANSWPAPAVDPRDALFNDEDTYPQESFSSKRSKSYNQVSANSWPASAWDQKDELFTKEEIYHQEYNGRRVITQEINRKSNIITQEINRNSVITQETNRRSFAQQYDKERIKQSFNQDYGNEEIISSEFIKENLRPSEVSNQEVSRKKFQEKSNHDLNQSLRRTSRENITQKNSKLSTVEKVLKLSQNYMNTVYKPVLCDIYFDKYKEKLPTKCLNAIKFCIQLDLDDSINEFLNAESRIEQINQEGRFLKDKEERHENSLLCQKEITKPKELDLKDIGEEFWVLIYNCESFINVWGIIMDADHFGKVEELADQLKNYFQFESKIQTVKVEENSYYAVFDGSWHRVQCIKCNETTAEVFFVDRGDRDNISIDRLHKLDPKFFKLPAQAINMSLTNLEMFTDCDGTHKMLDELLFEKAVYVIVKSSNAEKKPCLSVQLYITEDNETVNVNELLMKKLFQTVLNPLHYIREDNAEHIEFLQTNETGLFIQLHTVSLKYFKLLMDDLIEKCCDENLKRQKVVRFEGNKIYLVKRSRGNKFQRARVLGFKTENLIEVLLIDTGIVTFINREDFFALEKLNAVLEQYPVQAIEVQLDQITVLHPKIIDHIHSLTSNSNELYVKFLKAELENNNTPIIKLFKKVNGYLISVNDAILIEHNDILESQPNISSKPKPSEDNFDEKKLESVESNFGQCKLKSVESNFGEAKPKSAVGNFGENIPKSDEGNFGKNVPNSNEGNFGKNIPKSNEGTFGENKQKSAENSFGENKRKSAENTFGENKRKSAECSFGENKPKSAAGNFSENQPKLAAGNFNENQPKPAKDIFFENKQKSVDGYFNENKQNSADGYFNENKSKLAENNLTIKKQPSEESVDELISFKNNFMGEIERLKLFEAELTRPVEAVDCTKLCISGLLNPPVIPKGRYFDVHVVLAKDPSYFVIQLLRSKSVELKKMTQEMSVAYVDYRGPKLTYRSLGVGQMYAYRCESSDPQMWYRVYLLKIKDVNIASVYFCDYGWYKDVNIEDLVCLQRPFYTLPYLAVWAELYSAKPASGHLWTPEACSRFKELVESKNFICSLKGVKDVKVTNRNKLVPVTVEYIYVVKLIDTSTDEDLYIADILIDDGHATRKSSNSNT